MDQPVVLSRSAVQLRLLLDQGHRLNKRDAAKLLQRHERSITRLVKELRRAGVPVQDEKDPRNGRAKRFYLDAEHQRRGIVLEELDEQVLFALTVAAEAAGGALAGTPLAEPLRRGFAALLSAVAHLPDDAGDPIGPYSFEPEDVPTSWHFGSLAAEPPDPDVFSELRRAIVSCQAIRVDYVNGKGRQYHRRELEPLALAPIHGIWLLVAFCKLRGAVRDFNIARVSHVHPVSRYFTRPDDFDARAHFSGRFGALAGSDAVEVRLTVAPERAVYFESRQYHSSQVVKRQEDDSLVVTYRVPNLDDVRAFVASWGPFVVVLDPPELRSRIAADAAATIAAYGTAP